MDVGPLGLVPCRERDVLSHRESFLGELYTGRVDCQMLRTAVHAVGMYLVSEKNLYVRKEHIWDKNKLCAVR